MKFTAITAILIKGVKEILREPHILFWIIVFPLFYLSVSTIWIRPSTLVILNIGVVYEDETISSYPFNATTIVEIMNKTEINETRIFNIKVYENTSEALNAIREGEIDACIVFPNKFSLNLTMGIPVHMNVYLSTADIQKLQITDGIIRGFLSEFSSKMAVIRAKMAIEYMRMFANYTEYIPMNFTFPINQSRLMELWVMGLAQPMKISYAKIAPKGGRGGWGESMGWMTLSMVGVQFLFAGMLSAAVTIAEERDKGTLRRMLAAPLSPWDVLLGYTLVILFEIVLSTIAIITYGTFVMHAKIYWNPLTNPVHIFIPIILLLAGLFSIGVGLIISMISRTSRTATLISQAISWPLMFLSGITYPKFMLPQVFRNFADVFPLTIAVETMREIVVFGKGLEIVMTALPYLTIISIAVYILGALAYRKIVEKMII